MPKRRTSPPPRFLGAAGKLADRNLRRGFRRALRRSEPSRFGVESLLPFEATSEFETGPSVGTHWIEIQLVGEDEKPIPGVRYVIVDPDGRQKRGVLDEDGRARVERIQTAGQCKITFPDLDGEAWEAA